MTSEARHTLAWWLWTIAQLVTLALFAAQTPLSARFPLPIEDSAAAAVLCVQVSLAIFLAPALLPDLSAATAAGAVGSVVLAAATLLAGDGTSQFVRPLGLLILWLFALVPEPARPVPAVLALVTITGPMLLWATAEIGDAATSQPWLAFTPAVGAASTCLHSAPILLPFVLPTLLIFPKLFRKRLLQTLGTLPLPTP